MPGPTRSRSISLFTAACLLSLFSVAANAQIRFDLPAQPLAEALTAVGSLANLNIYYDPPAVKGLRAPAMAAELTPDDAIARLLAGTRLHAVRVNENTVRVVEERLPARAAKTPANDTGALYTPASMRLASTNSDTNSKSDNSLEMPVMDSSTPNESADMREHKPPPEEIVVTGSRIPQAVIAGPQEIQVFSVERIDQSGQTTIADFLSTLPAVSVNTTESPFFFNQRGTTAVQLHGLPLGTTLVLVNGRRVESSGAAAAGDFFDLNSIPVAAVDRLEVLPDGSSAIYGSDAIAGVVNIILKHDFNGLELSAKQGWARNLTDSNANFVWGNRWESASLTIVGSYEKRGGLTAFQRRLTADADYTAFGGPNDDFPTCNPGNVFSVDGNNLPGLNAPYAAVPAGFSGPPSIAEFQGTAGAINQCKLQRAASLIPASQRRGIFLQGSLQLTPSVEMFAEFLYSRVEEDQHLASKFLFGTQGFQSFTVSAVNPYNPFGVPVGIGYAFDTLPPTNQNTDTGYVRPLIGAKFEIGRNWRAEIAAWESKDSSHTLLTRYVENDAAIEAALGSPTAATALNPFVVGSPASESLLKTFWNDALSRFSARKQTVSGFGQGPLVHLPAGSLQVVVGSEYSRDSQDVDDVDSPPPGRFSRSTYALFAEARVPIVPNRTDSAAGDILTAHLAYRFDHYSDFGGTTNPQIGLEWRPYASLLLRANYAKSFKAPSLIDLYEPKSAFTEAIVDPSQGQTVPINYLLGGNPRLRPLTGNSRSVGFVYSSRVVPGFEVSIANWRIQENSAIVTLGPQVVVDNPALFPGRIVRDPATGQIISVDTSEVNFGTFAVAGFDYQMSYRLETAAGTFVPSLSATQTYHYTGELVPGAAAVNRAGKANDDGSWAPHWKATVALSWKRGLCAASIDGRYVGRYTDYDPLPDGTFQTLGNFWYVDANIHYDLGMHFPARQKWLGGFYIAGGAVNLFNRTPQFSNLQFGFAGYDGTQADIRGRVLYAQVGLRL